MPPAMMDHMPLPPGYEWRIDGNDLLPAASGLLTIWEIIENGFD